jgi:hypothetical protein
LCAKVALEPCVEAGEVDGRCSKEVLEVGFGVSNITAAAQSETANALRQSAFDPGTTGISFLPDLAFLLDAPAVPTMVKDQVADAFDGWLREAEASALAPFAAGLRRDEDAVRAALTEPWSNGQVEGQVNRLKVIKQKM